MMLQVEDMEQMDIPLEMRDTSVYCATSAHKINHSFQPNCRFSRFNHPRCLVGNFLIFPFSILDFCIFNHQEMSVFSFFHPRFGPIPCVTTIQHVKKGEELFSYYRFKHVGQ